MLQFDFKEQVCIVTGGTRGIGRSISEKFLHAGATVYATYASNDEAAEKFKSEMGELGERLRLAKFDVSDYEACEKFYKQLDDDGVEIQILINNSGIRRDGLILMMKEDDWDKVLDINLKGTFNMTKFAVQKFIRKRYGRIINVSSIGGVIGLAGQTNYSASKAGQIAFSKSLSKEVAKRGVTVNNVAPGFVETELIGDLPEKQVEEYKKMVPAQRFAKVDEISNSILFLASKEASYITGTTLEITGGL